jgi:hypothetical protein
MVGHVKMGSTVFDVTVLVTILVLPVRLLLTIVLLVHVRMVLYVKLSVAHINVNVYPVGVVPTVPLTLMNVLLAHAAMVRRASMVLIV